MGLFSRNDTRRIDGTAYVVVETFPLDRRVRETLANASAVQVDSCDPAMRDLAALLPASAALRKLIVTDLGIRDISHLASFAGLEELTLFVGRLGKGGGCDLARMEHLRRLALRWEPGVSISGSRSLERLMIERPSRIAIDAAVALPALHHLDVRNLGVFSPPARPVHAPLSTLRLAQARPSDGGAWLGSLEGLKELTLDGVVLGSVALPASLTHIHLEDCGDLGDAMYLRHHRNLRHVRVVGTTRLDGATVDQLRAQGVHVALPPN